MSILSCFLIIRVTTTTLLAKPSKPAADESPWYRVARMAIVLTILGVILVAEPA